MERVIVFPPKPRCLMTPPIAAFKPAPPLLLRLTPAAFRFFAATSSAAAPSTSSRDPETVTVPKPSTSKPSPNGSKRSSARDKKVNIDANQLRLNWLDSLSCPRPDSDKNRASDDSDSCNADSGWVVGIDPDLSGALAVIKPDNSPQVYDSPHLSVLVGKRVRKRLDVKSIIQLLQSVDAPIGTTVYIEQSIPYPQDGKQYLSFDGFESCQNKGEVEAIIDLAIGVDIFACQFCLQSMDGGVEDGYGLWIGILVASGYSVVPIPSSLWKNAFKLTGDRSSKDNSRELASTLFPSVSSQLKRKKDHGRAEALLIAAYGKGLKVNIDSSCMLEDQDPTS